MTSSLMHLAYAAAYHAERCAAGHRRTSVSPAARVRRAPKRKPRPRTVR